jgi:hypothetical protein
MNRIAHRSGRVGACYTQAGQSAAYCPLPQDRHFLSCVLNWMNEKVRDFGNVKDCVRCALVTSILMVLKSR